MCKYEFITIHKDDSKNLLKIAKIENKSVSIKLMPSGLGLVY